MTADRQESGIVFNIQKYSVHDGPGIRTVVFLKGCPLRCQWCANPESQFPGTQVMWSADNCQSCGHCIQVCPTGSITRIGETVRVDHETCSACGVCVRECPGRALKTEGKRMTVRQVMDVVMQDLPFYEESGGGLTLSGGELLAQPAFAKHLLLAAKEEGLHTCCETTGYAKQAIFTDVTDAADVLLFDIKHWDSQAHQRGTAATNELQLLNFRTAIHAGREVLPRIPVIPAFNDSLSDAEGLSVLLAEAGAHRCQLLPFHQFGENKYALLGKNYLYSGVPAFHREDLEPYRQIFLQRGIDAFF